MISQEAFSRHIARDIGFVRKRKGFKVPFDPQKIVKDILKSAETTKEIEETDAVGVTGDILGILHAKFYDANIELYPGVDDILDVTIHCLYEYGFARTADNFKIYRAGKQHVREGIIAEENLNIGGNPPIFRREVRWQEEQGFFRLRELNELIKSGKLADIIAASNKRYEKAVTHIAEEVVSALESRGHAGKDIAGFSVTGPSSSGKTTTTDKITEKLGREGMRVKTVPVDNYFTSLETHKKDMYGDFDFEEPHAIDVEYFFSDLEKILNREEVLLPYYDFEEGKSYAHNAQHPKRENLKLEQGDVLALDFLHLLYIMAKNRKLRNRFFIAYAEPMFRYGLSDGSMTRYTEVNMLRRCARDSLHRGRSFNQTIEHWGHVRDGQLTYMVPLLKLADTALNSGMIYDYFLLKSFMSSKGGPPDMPLLRFDKRKRLNYALFSSIRKVFSEIDDVPFESFLRHLNAKDLAAEFVPVPGKGYRKQ